VTKAVEVPFRLVGYMAHMSPEHAHLFYTKDYVRQFNPKTRKSEKRMVRVPFYRELDAETIAVPFGLVLFLIQASKAYKFKITAIVNENSFRPFAFHAGNAFLEAYLRDFQLEAFGALSHTRGGAVELPTGTGKSSLEIAVGTSCAVDHDVAFLMPSDVTRNNIFKAFGEIEARVGSRFSGFTLIDYEKLRYYRPEGRLIIIASAKQALNDLLAGIPLLHSVGTLVSDESHHWEADTWQAFLSMLPGVVRSYGFSATMLGTEPTDRVTGLTTDDANIIAGSGPIRYARTPQQLKQWLDLPDIANFVFVWGEKERVKGNNWTKIYGAAKKYGARLRAIAAIADLCSSLGRITTIPVAHKDMGLSILKHMESDKALCWFGQGAAVTRTGSVKKYDHDDIKRLVDEGRYDTLIVTSHVDESFDLPAINTTILSEGRKSRKTKQRAGRSVRQSGGGSFVINFYDVDGGIVEFQAKARAKDLQEYYETDVTVSASVDDLRAVLTRPSKEDPTE
jgi:superfamily II DNA or RNA helicase